MHCANLFPVGEHVHSPKPICSETVRTCPGNVWARQIPPIAKMRASHRHGELTKG